MARSRGLMLAAQRLGPAPTCWRVAYSTAGAALPARIRAQPTDELLQFLAQNQAALEAIRAKHKVEVHDARWYANKAAAGVQSAAGWVRRKGEKLVTTSWPSVVKEALRKKSKEEKEEKQKQKLVARADSDKMMRRYYIGRDVQGTIVCKQVSFQEGCEMSAFAEKVRDAEALFKDLPAFPDLTIKIVPVQPPAVVDSSASSTDSSSSSSSAPASAEGPPPPPPPPPLNPEARITALASEVLGGTWKLERKGTGYRLEPTASDGLGDAEVIKFNEQDFTVIVRESCTPLELRDFLAKDAVRVSKAQKAHFDAMERLGNLVTPTCARLGLESIAYNLKVGEETEGDVTSIVNQLSSQSIYWRPHLRGLRLRVSAHAATYELDLEKDFALILPARLQRPLSLHIPIHYRMMEVTRRVAVGGRYVAFLVFVTLLGDVEFL